MMLKKIKNPAIFQGNLHKKNYFEGWYFKQAPDDEKSIISFIPGICLCDEDPHAFVQYILVTTDQDNNKTTRTGYIRYELESFRYANKPFQIMIGENSFSLTALTINLKDQDFIISGELQLGPLTSIKTSSYIPNIMGPFAYFPWMECNHGIISMNHRVSGSLIIHSKRFDFHSAKGYIEKDWGTSFPRQYVWIQSNHFQSPDTSLFLSVAHIPFVTGAFRGFICNLVVSGQEYRFATYNKSNIVVHQISSQQVSFTLHNRKASLHLEAFSRNPGELVAPVSGKMKRIIKEGHFGEVYIKLIDIDNNVIYQDIGQLAGIEIVGYALFTDI